MTIPSDLLEDVVHHVWTLHSLGYKLFATAETYPFLTAKSIPCSLIYYADSENTPNIRSLISNSQIDLVINLPTSSSIELKNNYQTRRTAVDFGVPLLTNPQLFKLFVESLRKHIEGKLTVTQVIVL